MSNQEALIQKLQQIEQSIHPAEKQPSTLFKILVFETLGTALFAYGIVASRGNDYLISLYLFAGIYFAAKFTGGHVLILS